jgi:DNA mismatch repair protein MutL
MTIRILPPEVAARIAAGEVVERPSSVVKELVENALDAGASAIAVEIAGGGKRLIEVGDNGSGIRADEVEIAFQRYATSKLTCVEDLDGIRTLGFRGEALASIATVSRLTLVTRAADEQSGTRLRLEGGEIVSRGVIGAPQGTLVTIENLFFNVPARLKFLKKDTTERKQVAALVSRYAMAYPGVRFTLVQAGREALVTSGSGDLHDVLGEVYGVEIAAQMIPIKLSGPLRDDLPAASVSGLVSPPELNRADRTQITLFVNGRWIQDASLTYAVVQAYRTMLMQGRFPLAVVMVDLPPEEVDVNVHPTKAEVRFRRPDAVFSAVLRAIRRTLVDQAPVRGVSDGVFWGQPDWAARRDRLSQVTQERLGQGALDLALDRPGQVRQQQPPPDAGSSTPLPQPRRALPMLRVVGQVGAMYIVAEGPQGLYLIDQHAAHERVLYEQFMAERAGEAVHSQELLEPLAVELLPEQMALVEESLDILGAAGFIVEPFGRNTVRLRALPLIAAGGDPVGALLAALGEIECGEMPTEATAEERLIARVCKQASIKAGQVLSFAEMDALVRQLEACQSPKSCPHGRPTLLHLSAEQLAKEFGRLGAV